ncbi:MAG TPA: LysM peptidoglycan-binding domain-containing protein [Trebonia sp.]|nr:LysM peptidoglycan-binding domain-containing protein [Trebonia sp.]
MKIRRTGRHKTPSQVEKVAAQAGKAAPAMAIAGALVAAPHAVASVKPAATTAATSREAGPAARITLDSVTAKGVSGATAHQAAIKALTRNIEYTVRSGDTLSGIAQTYYHNVSDWQWLYHENDTRISDPNVIYPGQTVFVPADPPANYSLPGYVPRHAKPAAPASAAPAPAEASYSSGGGSDSTVVTQSASEGQSSTASASSTGTTSDPGSGYTTLTGTLSCSGLEQLWDEAGGNPSDGFMAAEIAMAESGGNQYALSPTDDYGYWQINSSNGSLATFNPYGNARSAIILSDDGTNWSPWTTYTSGAYAGRC